MGMECSRLHMDTNTKETGRTTSNMEMVQPPIQMDLDTQAAGIEESGKAKASSLSPMVGIKSVSLLMMNLMGWLSSCLLLVMFTKVTSGKGSLTAKAT